MKFLDRPKTEAVDPRMFGKDWWTQPLPARFASIDAYQAGLLVQVAIVKLGNDMAPRITWRGTAAQFQSTKYFSKGVSVKRSSGKWVYPDELRGTVYPDGEDRFLFVIEDCHFWVSSGRLRAKRAREARSDDGYLRFRECLLNTTINE